MIGEKLADAVTQLVANRRPGRRHIEVANVVCHKTGARAEKRDVAATLFHQAQLVLLNRLTQFIVADFEVSHLGHDSRILDARNLLVSPGLQRWWGGGVVTVAVDDE